MFIKDKLMTYKCRKYKKQLLKDLTSDYHFKTDKKIFLLNVDLINNVELNEIGQLIENIDISNEINNLHKVYLYYLSLEMKIKII